MAIPIIIGSHRVDPTNLAGPGLDFFAYFSSLLISIYCLVRAISNSLKLEKTALLVTLIHALGFTGILILFFIS
ncbi:MAG: hypothetical protein H7068_01045 [Pedobacter sp.]|nr:hypothetical protein [Chitinophagaceae bacterium]